MLQRCHKKLCTREDNPVQREISPHLAIGIEAQNKEKHTEPISLPSPLSTGIQVGEMSVVLQWPVLLQDSAALGWSPAASPASRSTSWTLQPQIFLVLLLLCCAVPCCCRAGVASLSCSLAVPFIDVGVRAVLAVQASPMKEMRLLWELWLLLCLTISSSLGQK